MPNEFTLCNALHNFLTLNCQKTLSELYLSTKGTVFHFTRISLYTIYFEKQKSCKVRATCRWEGRGGAIRHRGVGLQIF